VLGAEAAGLGAEERLSRTRFGMLLGERFVRERKEHMAVSTSVLRCSNNPVGPCRPPVGPGPLKEAIMAHSPRDVSVYVQACYTLRAKGSEGSAVAL
jgi:hypothetical protein